MSKEEMLNLIGECGRNLDNIKWKLDFSRQDYQTALEREGRNLEEESVLQINIENADNMLRTIEYLRSALASAMAHTINGHTETRHIKAIHEAKKFIKSYYKKYDDSVCRENHITPEETIDYSTNEEEVITEVALPGSSSSYWSFFSTAFAGLSCIYGSMVVVPEMYGEGVSSSSGYVG